MEGNETRRCFNKNTSKNSKRMCPSNVLAMAHTYRTTVINQSGKLLRSARTARDVYHSSKLKLQQSQVVPHRKFSAN